MGATYRLLAIGNDWSLVPAWFGALSPPPELNSSDRGAWLYFRDLGALRTLDGTGHGAFDPYQSPLVTLFPPQQRRGALWTAGEVHFLTSNLAARFPKLESIRKAFAKWLRGFTLVKPHAGSGGDWDYYLEGSLRNLDSPIYGLPEAVAALKRGQYFVAEGDTPHRLNVLCKALRRLGVEGLTTE